MVEKETEMYKKMSLLSDIQRYNLEVMSFYSSSLLFDIILLCNQSNRKAPKRYQQAQEKERNIKKDQRTYNRIIEINDKSKLTAGQIIIYNKVLLFAKKHCIVWQVIKNNNKNRTYPILNSIWIKFFFCFQK